MTEALLVLSTCSSKAEAEKIAQALVAESLAACVNILPAVASIYRWQGAVERSEEHLLLIKTAAARFSQLRDRLQALHSYDTPEIIATAISDGSERYLAWLAQACANPVI